MWKLCAYFTEFDIEKTVFYQIDQEARNVRILLPSERTKSASLSATLFTGICQNISFSKCKVYVGATQSTRNFGDNA